MQIDETLRRQSRRRVLGWVALPLLYVLVAMALLGANPFRGEITGPFDLLASYPGWNPGEEVEVRNGERSDVVDWLLPGWMESRRQLRDGTPPLWNPLQAGGRAAFLDPSNAQATVGFAVFVAMPDPALGFYLAVVATLALAGLGMHLLVARDYSVWSALFAGTGYMACGFVTAWLYWPHVHTAMWIPWLLLAVGCFARTRSRAALAGIAIATALMFLGGFPFVVALGIGAALVHGAISVMQSPGGRDRIRGMLGVVAGIALGLALVAIPLLTLVSVIDGIDMAQRTSGSGLRLSHARLLALPWAGDKPRVESSMYVGMLALVLAPVGLATLVVRRDQALALTAAVLTAVGAILTFEILPREIGGHLPVLSNNLWSRAILLLDIGLVLLAARGLDLVLGRLRWGWATVCLGLVLCLVQGGDLGHQFRKFNGATPSKYFYPVGPALAELRERARPFEYVAQDSGQFLISGTLGAVGLGDWFAHALRTPQLGNLLDAMSDDPFSSPTATAIPISRYHFGGAVADGSGLCYAAYAAGATWGPVVYRPHGTKSVALPPINGTAVTQPFVLARPEEVAALRVRMATYRAKTLDGVVSIELRQRDGSVALGAATISGADVRDNEFAVFRFPKPLELPVGDYEIVLLYSPGPQGKRMTAWMLSDAPGFVMHGGTPHAGALTFSLLAPEDGSVREIAESDGTAIARSNGCPSGAYWLGDMTRPWASARPEAATLTRYRPHAFAFEVNAPSAGFLVVPMQYQDGWSATIEGRPAQLRLVHGVMPAVGVPAGPTKVTLSYRPPGLGLGLLICVPALLVLGWLLSTASRRSEPGRGGARPQGTSREQR